MTSCAARFLALPLSMVLLAALGDLHAQRRREAVREDSALAVRMRGFSEAVARSSLDSAASYFPRAGDWTWVHTRTGERMVVGRWRFPAADARRAIGDGGPLCFSFHSLHHGAPLGHWLVDAADDPGGWRYAGGGRYVPRGRLARYPIFVQWRREGAEWVVSAVGDHSPYYDLEDRDPGPPLLGYPLGLMIVRDTTFPLPDPPVDVRTTDWYPTLRYQAPYEMWGQPRPLEPDSIRRYGRIGRVPIYRNHDDRRDPPGVLYVLTGPERTYQPFVDWSAFERCR